jgi:hypothetical protein
MIKKDTLGNVSAKSLKDAFKCGECLHFKQHAHSTRNEPCSKEGVRAVAVAPKCFTPDVTKIAKNSDLLVQVATIMQSFTPGERRILKAVLSQNKKRQYTFGDKLYFKVGKDFVSNYLAGYVLGYTSSGQLILSGSPDTKTRGSSFVSYVAPDSDDLLTPAQWKQKRAQLRQQNKIFDPANRVIKRTSVIDDYEPPTIDSVPSNWYSKEEPAPKRRRTDGLTFNM